MSARLKALWTEIHLTVYPQMRTMREAIAFRAGQEYTDEMEEAGRARLQKSLDDILNSEEYKREGTYP